MSRRTGPGSGQTHQPMGMLLLSVCGQFEVEPRFFRLAFARLESTVVS